MNKLVIKSSFSLLAAAAIIIGALVGTAAASQAAGSITVSVGSLAPVQSAVEPEVAGVPSCSPATNSYVYNRTVLCWELSIVDTLYKGTKVVGTVSFHLTSKMQVKTTSRDWSESLAISDVQVTGSGGGVSLALTVSCGSPCKATNHFPQNKVIAARSGTIDYADSIAKGKVHGTTSLYELTASKSGYTSAKGHASSPVSYRCDDSYGKYPGCVFPQFTPTITSLAPLPGIVANIKTAQAGPGHYGKPGGGHPLHHITSTSQQNKNYNAVCGRSVVGKPPVGKSCDEYPFKSTREGGTTLSKANRHTAWVPIAEQNSQGGRLSAFYQNNRVLNGDAFYVQV
jgi:hypothetical protein